MNLALYPRIEDETTTVRFIVDGMGSNPNLKDATRALGLFCIHGDVNTLQERLRDKEAATIKATELNTPPPQNPGNNSGNRGRGRGGRWRGRNDKLKARLQIEMSEQISKEFTSLKDTLTPPTKPREARAYAATEDENSDGTFLLDSAANPSLIKQSSTTNKYLTKPIPVRTANGTVNANKCCTRLYDYVGI